MDDNLNTQESAKPPIKTPDGLSPLERDIGTNTELSGGPNQAKPGMPAPSVPTEPPVGETPPASPASVPPAADEVPADQPITPPPADEPPPAPEEEQKSPEPTTGEPGLAPASPPAGASGPAPEPSTPPPGGGTENNKPVDLPDTDEFLQNIMGEEQKNAPQPETAPPSGSPPPSEPPSASGSGLPPEPPANPYEETPPAEEPPSEGETPSAEPAEAEKPGGAVNGVSPGQAGEQGVSNDIVGAMQKAPAKGSKNGLKLLGLIIVAVILVIGGYLGYRALFAPATPTATTKPSTVSATTTATVAQTLDDTRKSDLQTIAAALKDYKTSSGKYPVAATLVLLTDTSNPLTAALVPTYLTTMPSDPNVSKSYGYKSDGTTFTLSAVLDSTKDPDGVLEGGKYLYKVTESTVTSSASATSSPTATVTSGSTASPSAETNLPI